MFRRLFSALIILMIIPSGTVIAQRIYTPGYVISAEADTIHGLLSFSGFGKESKQLFYKARKDAAISIYRPDDIRGFFNEGQVFESAVVSTEVTRLDLQQVDHDPSLKLENDTVFLLRLVEGVKSLYFFENRVGKDQFYVKSDSALTLLVYKKYLVDNKGHRAAYENKRYLGQLAVLMGDCKSIAPKLNHLNYSKKALTDLFWKYNSCMGHASELSIEKKSPLEWSLIAGMNFTSFSLTKKPQTAMVNLDDHHKMTLTGGAALNFFVQRNRRNFSIYNELNYTRFNASGHAEKYDNELSYTLADSEIDSWALSLLHALQYTASVNKVNIFVFGGFTYPLYSGGSANTTISEVVFYSSTRTYIQQAIPDFEYARLAPVIGAGIAYKHFFLNLRFETRKDYTVNNYDYRVKMSKLFCLLGYRF